MANTTWNPSDKTANIALSGGNLTATQTASGANGGSRSVDRKTSGKLYWEGTFVVATNISTGFGIGNSATVLNGGISATSVTAVIGRSGTIFVGGSTAVTGSILANGTVVGIALDLDASRVWFRVGAAGNWNYSATADPTTGAGGIAIPVGGASAAYALALIGAQNDQITANFGDSAFTGTVPSGFTAGFPTGSPPLAAVATQVVLEEWAMPLASAQMTQVALEAWASPGAGNRAALLTQIALEQWAALPAALVARQNAVIVINDAR
jgi:hypothetical protein